MPTIPSIRTSIENKNVLVLDEHAKNGTFERDARNRLIAYAGGFSVVFPYKTSDGKKWAFRCWHSDVSNSKKRYETIAKAIRQAQLDFLCDFDYIEKGINVEGVIYPTTRMRWVDGITIKDYIYQNKESKSTLESLAENFLKMAHALHEQSLAHGDLQHGNILVDENHHLHLVDYDSFYCPELSGEPDTVTGLPDYQHPSRLTNKTVTEKIDYYSELIIYLSILAIAEKPSLVEKYKIKDADRLLFSKEDYDDIQNSQIYQDIHSLGGDFIELLNILEDYLNHDDINELKPFEIILQENRIIFKSSVTKAIRNSQQIEISWSVPFEAEISITKVGKGDPQVCQNTDSIKTTLEETTTYELAVKTKTGQLIKKLICIEVFDECEIEFEAEKYFVFPSVPVKLSWNVKHAKKVWLDSAEVKTKGSKTVKPVKNSTYTIKAEDEFGIKEEQIEIQMLPIPQVKSILVPTPTITNNMAINVKQPRYNVNIKFPKINMQLVDTEVPHVPKFPEMGLGVDIEPPQVASLTDLGLNVELSPPLPRFSLKESIKKVFNHIKK